MDQPTNPRTSGASASPRPPPSASAEPFPAPGTNAVNENEAFHEKDLPMLSLIAVSAAHSAFARSAEVVLDALLLPPTAVAAPSFADGEPPSSSQGQLPHSTAPVSTAAALPPHVGESGRETTRSSTHSIAPKSLAGRYPEVFVLLQLHYLRCALRDLQECPAHARRTFFTIVHEHLAALAAVLPDPLFVAMTQVLYELLESKVAHALDVSHSSVLEVQLAHVVEVTQTALLRATKQLSMRAGPLTLRFHHDIPYL